MTRKKPKDRYFDWANWVLAEAEVGDRINMEIHDKIYLCEIAGFTPEVFGTANEYYGWLPILFPINHGNSIPYFDKGAWVEYKAFVPTLDDLEDSYVLNVGNLKNIEKYRIKK